MLVVGTVHYIIPRRQLPTPSQSLSIIVYARRRRRRHHSPLARPFVPRRCVGLVEEDPPSKPICSMLRRRCIATTRPRRTVTRSGCRTRGGRALNNNQPIVLAALLLIAEWGGRLGWHAGSKLMRKPSPPFYVNMPSSVKRGGGRAMTTTLNRMTTGMPYCHLGGQSVQKEQTWKAGWGASTMSSPPARLDLWTWCRGQCRLGIGLNYCLVGYNWWCSAIPTQRQLIAGSSTSLAFNQAKRE